VWLSARIAGDAAKNPKIQRPGAVNGSDIQQAPIVIFLARNGTESGHYWPMDLFINVAC